MLRPDMADKRFPSLPGFRDFAPRDCAIRNYLFAAWRNVAQRYGFLEYEAPLLEATELYRKKAGEELNTQLFRFEDQGGRDVTLRPELTASLARMICAHQRDFTKPMKWFEIGPCFRYEAPQKGRGREFIQFNADIIGEDSPGADAELIALAIDCMIELGFTAEDFAVRASDRETWTAFCHQHNIENSAELLRIIDKWDREETEVLEKQLSHLGLNTDTIECFIADPTNISDHFREVQKDLEARGLSAFLKHDLTIVRGLAYYSGIVFEIFDHSRSLRAVAGGGRYADLIKLVSAGAIDLPCTGFAMGDMVIRNFIEQTPLACMKMESWLASQAPCQIYVMIADESKRAEALNIVVQLRSAGLKVDYSLSPTKFNKLLKKAEQAKARFGLIIGTDFPMIKLKILESRSEQTIRADDQLTSILIEKLSQPDDVDYLS